MSAITSDGTGPIEWAGLILGLVQNEAGKRTRRATSRGWFGRYLVDSELDYRRFRHSRGLDSGTLGSAPSFLEFRFRQIGGLNPELRRAHVAEHELVMQPRIAVDLQQQDGAGSLEPPSCALDIGGKTSEIVQPFLKSLLMLSIDWSERANRAVRLLGQRRAERRSAGSKTGPFKKRQAHIGHFEAGVSDLRFRVQWPNESQPVGSNGLSSIGSDASDTVTFDIDLASGSGLAFTSGSLTLQSCSDGQILKRVAGAWACAADVDTLVVASYKQQLAGTDNISVGSSLTPALTNGSGTAQSLGITITSGSEVLLTATIELSSSLATGPATYVLVRDDNHDNDCVIGGADGTQVGGQTTSFVASVAQSFTTSVSFVDTSPPSVTNYYQLCASTTIGLGTATITDRSLILHEINL